MINQNGTNAIFIDECFNSDSVKDVMTYLSTLVEILWIAPNARSQKENIDDFTTINLTKNLRNTTEIVTETKDVAEFKKYVYKSGLKTPPPNFPRGCRPIFVDTINEALDKARRLTSSGILVIEERHMYAKYVKNINKFDQSSRIYRHSSLGKGSESIKQNEPLTKISVLSIVIFLCKQIPFFF